MRRYCAFTAVLSVLAGATCFAQPATKPTTAPSLDEQVRALKAAGEPVTPAELKTWPTLPDERNAAKLVWSLKERMRQPTREGGLWGEALSNRGIEDYRPPLSDAEAEEIRKALEPQRDVLATLDRIPELDGFDWGPPPASPYAVRRDEFPQHAFSGTCRHQLYLDGLLAIHDRDLPRVWRRVEILRRLAEGMSTYPGEHDLGPLWPYLAQLSARLAIDAAGADAVSPEHREALAAFITYWLDERPMLDGAIRHYQRERVAVIETSQLIASNRLDARQLAKWGRDVHGLQERRMGVPMWPTVVAFYTSVIAAHRETGHISRRTGRAIYAGHEAFAKGGFVPTHVAMQLGPGTETWNSVLSRVRAVQKLAATALAVQLHRMDHGGQLPQRVEELVPKYLPSVPIDSLDQATSPIRYRREAANGAILWISGQDGKDNGGKERPPGVSRLDRRVEMDDVVRLGRRPATAPASAPAAP
jgi:hypothetical protein